MEWLLLSVSSGIYTEIFNTVETTIINRAHKLFSQHQYTVVNLISEW